MHNHFEPLEFQTPVYQEGKPVFPDAPQRVTPYILHNMKNWKWEVKIKDLTLQYVMGGHIAYELGGSTHEGTKGTCFLFKPGQKIAGRSLDGKPVTMFAAHFARLPTLDGEDAVSHVVIRETTLFEALAEHAVQCRQRTEKRAAQQTQTALLQLVHLFADNLALGPRSTVQLNVEEMIERIKRAPGDDWRTEVMCEQTGLSRSQLTRWFNRITGIPPNRYVIEHRIAHAVQMLGMTDNPVAEIAESLGYRDVQFFIRQFRKETGVSPGSLRKRRS